MPTKILWPIVVILPWIVVVWCWFARCGEPAHLAEAATDPHLYLTEDDVAAWMTFDNGFSEKGKWLNPNTGRKEIKPDSTYYRPGILFQLGAFEGADNVFDRIELQADGGDVLAEYGPEAIQFDWMNIVSVYPGGDKPHAKDPLDPSIDPFYLYPNDHVENCCDVVKLITDAAACEALDLQKCLRNRLLMAATDTVVAIVTYWHGPKGYRVEAKQDGWPSRPDRHRFWFKDDFRVEVYRAVSDASGDYMQLIDTYPSGTNPAVDEIIVHARSRPPEGGAKQAPPWPNGEFP